MQAGRKSRQVNSSGEQKHANIYKKELDLGGQLNPVLVSIGNGRGSLSVLQKLEWNTHNWLRNPIRKSEKSGAVSTQSSASDQGGKQVDMKDHQIAAASCLSSKFHRRNSFLAYSNQKHTKKRILEMYFNLAKRTHYKTTTVEIQELKTVGICVIHHASSFLKK